MITTVTLNASIDRIYYIQSNELGKVQRVREALMSAGGKGLNVSRVLCSLGEDVCTSGFAGGFMGKWIEDNLDKANMKHKFAHTKGETRNCINIIEDCGRQTEYLEGGCNISSEELDDFMNLFEELLEQSSVITLSGSVPKGVPSNYYGKLITKANEKGIPVLLDTSNKLLIESIGAKPTLIKPNKDEIEQLTGKTSNTIDELIQTGKSIHEDGIKYVVISLGKEGSLCICDEGVFKATPPTIKAVNATGCGDSMIAGLAYGLANKMSIDKTLAYATAVSAANALEASTGVVNIEDFKRLLPLSKVEKLS